MNEEERILDSRALKFETLKTQQERKNRRRRAFYIALIVIATLSFFVVVFTVLLKIGEIQVSGCTVYTYDEIVSALPVAQGDSLYGFDSKEAENAILNAFPYVRTVSVTRKIPSTLVITITEETPVFCIKAGSDYYLLSDDFSVLGRMDSAPEEGSGLVTLNTGYVKRCVTGEKLSFAETKLLNSIDELWKTLCYYGINDKINYIEAADRFDIYFSYDGRIRAYIGDIDACDTKIRFFMGVMEHIYQDQTGKLDISNPKEATFSPDK